MISIVNSTSLQCKRGARSCRKICVASCNEIYSQRTKFFLCYNSDTKVIPASNDSDLAGWKAKCKVPPKDNRIKTSVRIFLLSTQQSRMLRKRLVFSKFCCVCFPPCVFRMWQTQEATSLRSSVWNVNCWWEFSKRDGTSRRRFKRLPFRSRWAAKTYWPELKTAQAKLEPTAFLCWNKSMPQKTTSRHSLLFLPENWHCKRHKFALNWRNTWISESWWQPVVQFSKTILCGYIRKVSAHSNVRIAFVFASQNLDNKKLFYFSILHMHIDFLLFAIRSSTDHRNTWPNSWSHW